MPEVNVEIDGKKFRMACEEGQKGHLLELAERFNRTVIQLKGSFGEIGDNRLVGPQERAVFHARGGAISRPPCSLPHFHQLNAKILHGL